MKSDRFTVTSPIDGSVVAEYTYALESDLEAALSSASAAQTSWRQVSLDDRAVIMRRALDITRSQEGEIAEEICRLIGRPVSQGGGEVKGFCERADYMITAAEGCLTDLDCGEKAGFRRFIRREPIGVVAVIAPWNYPYMTAINSIAPALMGGNAVILKHASQTSACADRLSRIFRAAGLPEGVFQNLVLSHDLSNKMLKDRRVGFVIFTGSVSGGHSILSAMAGNFAGSGLELGGKDPAYVLPDCAIEDTVAGLTDGAFFNSGQSCCGIERIYVSGEVYNRFLDAFVAQTESYRLDNPLLPETTLGPVVKQSAADVIRIQIGQAIVKGARPLIARERFPMDDGEGVYLTPQVLVDVDHSMDVMTEETFGPVVGIMKVRSDADAIRLMNDSPYGLTASVWTNDVDRAIDIGNRVDTGTFYVNRCDYLDPALAWTGVKDTGRGISLSKLAYSTLTRVKSFHVRESF